jgi:hypothetical protein
MISLKVISQEFTRLSKNFPSTWLTAMLQRITKIAHFLINCTNFNRKKFLLKIIPTSKVLILNG